MKVVWTDGAEQNRSDIFDHIARADPRAAIRMDKRFSDAAAALADWPLKAPPGRVPGTRELLVHEHYYLVYEIAEGGDALYVLAVLHTSRRWPPVGE